MELGTGVKLLPNVKIGNHVHVGANCIIVEGIPDYGTVVLQGPRIIKRTKNDYKSTTIKF